MDQLVEDTLARGTTPVGVVVPGLWMGKGRHVREERKLAFDRKSSNAELICQLMLHETCREPVIGPGRGPEAE